MTDDVRSSGAQTPFAMHSAGRIMNSTRCRVTYSSILHFPVRGYCVRCANDGGPSRRRYRRYAITESRFRRRAARHSRKLSRENSTSALLTCECRDVPRARQKSFSRLMRDRAAVGPR
ncbi:hypothetical protein EVAR_63026_1 [Eumeta japonica]|uniref:Uncharacterized protein n=1 Tax=Eumeta variegata TaxID=151549 RepID=A0A4C1YW37_EUMVA|nr:hypothetical protein EVAR_63026_1 [Eumeta japonica]